MTFAAGVAVSGTVEGEGVAAAVEVGAAGWAVVVV